MSLEFWILSVWEIGRGVRYGCVGVLGARLRQTHTFISALAEHAIAAGEIPEAVVEAVGGFHEECGTLHSQCPPAARGGHLVGAGQGGARAKGAVVALPLPQLRRAQEEVPSGQ